MSVIKIVTPKGAFGASDHDSAFEIAIRVIAVAFDVDPNGWASKYGTDFENDVFLMKRFCWCDKEDGSCLWCMHGDHPQFDRLLGAKFGRRDYNRYEDRHYYDPPNFWFKPADFRLTWYKYIGRDMASNKDEIAGDFLHQIMSSHPTGITAEQAFERFASEQEEVSQSFAEMVEMLRKS